MKKLLCMFLLITMVLSNLTFTALASEEIVITTADSRCKLDGKWQESTNANVVGAGGINSWYTADKTSTATYDASGLESGNYGVYIYLTPYGKSAAAKVTATITASGKSTDVTFDGFEGGVGTKHWLFLGKYDFDGTDGDSVVHKIAADANPDIMRASGIKFVKNDTNTGAPGVYNAATTDSGSSASSVSSVPTTQAPTTSSNNEIVITTDDSRFKLEGSKWEQSTNANVVGAGGINSWFTADKKAVVTYDASGLEKGSYGVYMYLTPFGKSAAMMTVTVTASGKSSEIAVDGFEGGVGNAHWKFLGKYDFDGSQGDGISHRIADDAAADIMRASGVKFVKDDNNSTSVGATVTEKVETPKAEEPKAEEPKAEETKDPSKNEFTTVPETGFVTIGTAHPGFSKSGEWKESGLTIPSDGKPFYGTDKGSGTWYPNIAKADDVEVFYFKPFATDNEDPALKIEIFTEGQIKTITIDFTKEPTEWYSLGRYNFSGDGSEYIKCTGSGTGTARLTGLKFTKEVSSDSKYVSAFYGTELHILERMGMLIGEGNGITEEYIKKVPTRVQAAIMILRLNGLDAEAASFTGTDNFADANLEPWAFAYLAYLKAHPELGLIGTGDNMFEPTAEIDAQAYAKILLTALGYEYNVDFTWDETITFAKEKGITVPDAAEFTVNDLAVMTESILDLNCKDGSSYFTKLILERDGVKDEGVYGTELTEELKAAREEAKNKKRGLIYNNDGNDVYDPYPEYPGAFDISHLDGTTINTENFLNAPRNKGLSETQVDSVFYCTGVFNSYTHESSGVTDVRVRDWSRALKQYTGKDSLNTMIDYVHGMDKEIFWSMRMNDTHDANYEENELDPWKQANLDLLMYRKADSSFMAYGDWRWSSVDYTLTPVRQIVYDILKDTLTRYDIDGLELDFSRFMIYFKEVTQGEKVYPENVERMNNLIRMVRDMTEKISIERGKPILLAINVPNSLDYCMEVGLDIRKWLDEGLIDIASIGDIFGMWQTWEDSIKEYDGYDIPVYAVLDKGCIDNAKDPNTDEAQEAALAWASGADGIYTYNYFNMEYRIFHVAGSPETCGPLDPNYKSVLYPSTTKFVKDSKKYITYTK